MKLFLIRHGETTANVAQIYSGQQDAPLTELGRQQARDLRPVLAPFRFNRIFTSDLSRAVDTQRLAIPGVEGIRDPLLREYDVGTLANQPFQNVPDYSVYGGESKEMVCNRVRQFLAELEANPCDYVAAFAHGGYLKCALQVVMGVDYPRHTVTCGNCNVTVYEFDGKRWKLIAWNYGGKI